MVSQWSSRPVDHAVRTLTVTVTPTLDTNAYAANDVMGGKQTLTFDVKGVRGARVVSAQLADEDAQNIATDVYLYDSNPSASTFTDQSAFTEADADIAKRRVHLEFLTYEAAANNSVCHLDNVGQSVRITDGVLYAVLVTRGAPTYAADGLKLTVVIETDFAG